ncbi:MAG TPA: ABC transporter permease, partial [Caldimonas sp.]|nr:ABC transporter permease [Caldimonas sp.]
MPSLLLRLSWPELRHHRWRTAAALVAVALGVALAFSVHLINASALAEFDAATRAVGGEADLRIVGGTAGFDEALFGRVARSPAVALASPIVDVATSAVGADGKRFALRVIGVDALTVAATAPALLPHVRHGAGRFAMLDPDAAFLNAEALRRIGAHRQRISITGAHGPVDLHVAGDVAASGGALAVMDIAGAQVALGMLGRLSAIDVRLVGGADRAAVLRKLDLPADARVAAAGEAEQRASNVSRAYRVNLTVLALVALFTGAFLVFSILALSVARRQQQLALLGVVGLPARGRLALVLRESALLGVVGSALGLGLGTALALFALRVLGGDLGGGYFAGVAPPLRFDTAGAVLYGSLGVVAAMVGGWLPARAAERLAPAQALKGLVANALPAQRSLRRGLGLVLAGVVLAMLPPIVGLPLAAYVSIACLLIGGIACIPGLLGAILALVPAPRRPLPLLAIERARHERDGATIAVAGVVASLALAVALTVMVTSFREAVSRWLDVVLPADLYARGAPGTIGGELSRLPPRLPDLAAALPGVRRVEAQRITSVLFSPTQPAVTIIARRLADPSRDLPLAGALADAPPGSVPVYVSEAIVALYGWRRGSSFELPLPDGRSARIYVRGVWRDYARQFGAVAIDRADWQRLTGDDSSNDLAIWLDATASTGAVEAGLRRLADAADGSGERLEFASP